MDPKDYCLKLYKELKDNGQEERARMQTAYMKNKFAFAGLTTAERRALQKAFEKEFGAPTPDNYRDIVYLLWNIELRDCQMVAVDIMVKNKRNYKAEDLSLITYCITHHSWWDTVDMLAAHCAGTWFMMFPDKIKDITKQWMGSGNLWLQRSALLFQLKYKTDTDTELLEKYITRLTTHNDFFIRKAIGWILREYGKTNPEWVLEFVERTSMSELSRREALKRLTKQQS